jgi:endogenous inhibitor of DNA gyrase (YacG/DUF329 family)
MVTGTSLMSCPACGYNVKLGEISPRSNPIHKYPAVRGCPSCKTPLLFALPQWVVPLMIFLGFAGVFVVVYAMNHFGVFESDAELHGGIDGILFSLSVGLVN